MSDDVVLYEIVDEVAWVTINRPEARNALNLAVREGLREAITRFDGDDSAKVMVLTGAGDVFCAGADLKEMAENQMTVPPRDFIPVLGQTMSVAKPTIAAVNGAALAGGFLLAQMCDLCVATTTARFAISELKVGRGAPWAAPLAWLAPPRIAMELLVTGDPLSAQRLYEVGMINAVVEPAELRTHVQAMAASIAACAPLSVLAGKATVRLGAPELFDAADAIWEPVYRSRDAQEGPQAFREHRAPIWEDR